VPGCGHPANTCATPAAAIITCFEGKGNQKMQGKGLAVGVSLVMLLSVMGMAQQPPQDKGNWHG